MRTLALALITADLFACAPAEPDPNAVVELTQSELPPQQPSSLTGTSWRLRGYDSFESGSKRATPAPNEIHFIRFWPDGVLQLRLACHTGKGLWRASQHEPDRGSIEITKVEISRMPCRDTRMTRMAEDLELVRSYVIGPGDRLTLNLRADSGNLVWERAR